MVYQKTEWKDQNVESPRTYSVRQNLDGTITLLDAFGEITEVGTPVNAENMNNIENGIVQNESDISKRKFTGYEKYRHFIANGNLTVDLQTTDEIIDIYVKSNSNITFDFSNVVTPESSFYTIQVKFYPAKAQVFTVSLQLAGLVEGAPVVWVNGNVANLSEGKGHWLVLRTNKSYALWSDAGAEG